MDRGDRGTGSPESRGRTRRGARQSRCRSQPGVGEIPARRPQMRTLVVAASSRSWIDASWSGSANRWDSSQLVSAGPGTDRRYSERSSSVGPDPYAVLGSRPNVSSGQADQRDAERLGACQLGQGEGEATHFSSAHGGTPNHVQGLEWTDVGASAVARDRGHDYHLVPMWTSEACPSILRLPCLPAQGADCYNVLDYFVFWITRGLGSF